MRRIAAELKTFRLREEKPVPAFLDCLGWCTWDAFYHEVSERNVLNALRSLAKAGIKPGFMILDDGWLDATRIASLARTADEIILQGIDNAVAWQVLIDEKSEVMSLSLATGDGATIGFGDCVTVKEP